VKRPKYNNHYLNNPGGSIEKRFTSVSELALAAAQDPNLEAEIKNNPSAAIASLAAPLQNGVWVYRMVVAALGLVVLIAIVGAIILAWKGDGASNTLNLLTALGSAAVGALAGLLAPAPRQQ
jgi:hypothetical protein